MTHHFKQITESMSQAEAGLQYEELRKLLLNDDGTYNADGILDVMRVEHALAHGRVPTRAEMRAELRRKEIEDAKLNLTDAQCRALYEQTLRRPS
jgi:hypothetical protein